jgi:CDP-diacylglycerol pyrophosphatase
MGRVKIIMRQITLALLMASIVSAGVVAGSLPGLSRPVLGFELSLSRNDLWRVIHRICIPASKISLPFPCTKVVQRDGGAAGYAILPVGAGHILTVPTQRIAGIESREVFSPEQPNYWQAAWEQRERLDDDFSRKLDRSDVALALNSAYGRSQDQLHIHTACVRGEVKAALAIDRAIGPHWSRLPTSLGGSTYWVRWAPGVDLSSLNVFDMLPGDLRHSPADMARQTLIVVGGWDRNHAPGFFILNDQAGARDDGHGEKLLDFECAR